MFSCFLILFCYFVEVKFLLYLEWHLFKCTYHASTTVRYCYCEESLMSRQYIRSYDFPITAQLVMPLSNYSLLV
ncbi:hypothetical protein OIU77_002474 [Salix suchowensis]|uniref:Secreted protein n=1 Tax=Salix suchowensis TaxID=1278906 RepID=A0ABQ9AZB2_9ROSI|nr:hypothetical protein OIU77_002474 [Salix suchowensis]